MGERRTALKEKKAKKIKPVNMGAWMPVMIVLGFALGIVICWLTFSHLGGNYIIRP